MAHIQYMLKRNIKYILDISKVGFLALSNRLYTNFGNCRNENKRI